MNVSRLEKDLLKPGPGMWRLTAYERFPLDRHRALTGRRLNSALPAIRSTAEACGSRDAVSLRYTPKIDSRGIDRMSRITQFVAR